MVLISLCPELLDVRRYILTQKAEWSYLDLSKKNLAAGTLFTLILTILVDFYKSTKDYSYFLLFSCFSMAMYQLSYPIITFTENLEFGTIFIFLSISRVFSDFSLLVPPLVLIARYSKIFPEGLESTGVNIIIGFSNLGRLTEDFLSMLQIRLSGMKAGYYKRIRKMMVINCWCGFILCFLAPFFLIWKVKWKSADDLSHAILRNKNGLSQTVLDNNKSSPKRTAFFKKMRTIETKKFSKTSNEGGGVTSNSDYEDELNQ